MRVMLPSPFTTVVGFASLSKSWLAPHDTIHTVIKSADGSHGLVEMTFGAPTESRSKLAPKGITITGEKGFIFVNQVQVEDGGPPRGVNRVSIKTIKRDKDGKDIGEEEEVSDHSSDGVPQEIGRFVKAVKGEDDGMGNPRNALLDVAFIQAALTSNGAPVDMVKLVQ